MKKIGLKILLTFSVLFLTVSSSFAITPLSCSEVKTKLVNNNSETFWYVLNDDTNNAKPLGKGESIALSPFYSADAGGFVYSGKISFYKKKPKAGDKRSCYVGVNWDLKKTSTINPNKQCVLLGVPGNCLNYSTTPSRDFKEITIGIKNLKKD